MDVAAAQPVLAIDLGGTQIRAAHVAPDLTVSARSAIPTEADAGPDVVIERLCDLADVVQGMIAAEGLQPVCGVGISAPGPLDPWRGLVVSPPNLAGWVNVPLADRVQERLGLPTLLERDTNVAMMAEWRYGAARNADDAVYVTISTGIGGGIVVRGEPLQGSDNTAGEVGHMTVDLDGPLCGDGMPGHAEAIGSGTAIAREGRSLLERGEAPILAGLAASTAVDAALVAQAADAGDAACQAVYERAYVAVGALCASLVMAFNPQVIVLGGSVATHRPQLAEVVRREIDRRAFPGPARRVRLAPARFGDDVSLIGSVPIVNERLDDPAYRRSPVGDAVVPGATTQMEEPR